MPTCHYKLAAGVVAELLPSMGPLTNWLIPSKGFSKKVSQK
jgi:hypothetical protein